MVFKNPDRKENTGESNYGKHVSLHNRNHSVGKRNWQCEIQNEKDKAWKSNQPGRNVAENFFIQFAYIKCYEGRKEVNF